MIRKSPSTLAGAIALALGLAATPVFAQQGTAPTSPQATSPGGQPGTSPGAAQREASEPPRSIAEEVREELRRDGAPADASDDAARDLREAAQETRAAGREAAEEVRDAAEETRQAGREAAADVREAAREANEERERDRLAETPRATDADRPLAGTPSATDADRPLAGTPRDEPDTAVASADEDERDAGAAGRLSQAIDATGMTARVKSALVRETADDALAINVESHEGIVQLNGFVSNQDVVQRAEQVARNVDGVREVRNNLEVSGAQGMGRTAADAAISTRVKTALITEGDTRARNIAVEVNDGTVQLGGFVDSEDEKSRAEQVARNVDGVREVTNNLELREMRQAEATGLQRTETGDADDAFEGTDRTRTATGAAGTEDAAAVGTGGIDTGTTGTATGTPDVTLPPRETAPDREQATQRRE